MRWFLDNERERALYDWLVMGLPPEYTVIWAEPKVSGKGATHPNFPYATMKIVSVTQLPTGVGYEWSGHRINISGEGKSAGVAVDGVDRVVSSGSTKTAVELAAMLADEMNDEEGDRLSAVADGANIIVEPKNGCVFTLVAKTNCSAFDRFLRKTSGAFMLSVNTYSTDDGHFAAVKNIIYSAKTAAAQQILRRAGIAYHGGEGIHDLTFLDETGFIRRAQIDIMFGYGDAFVEEVQQIQRVIASAEVKKETGEPLMEISTTIDL